MVGFVLICRLEQSWQVISVHNWYHHDDDECGLRIYKSEHDQLKNWRRIHWKIISRIFLGRVRPEGREGLGYQPARYRNNIINWIQTKHTSYPPNILPTTLPYSTRTTYKAIKYTSEMTLLLADQHAISIIGMDKGSCLTTIWQWEEYTGGSRYRHYASTSDTHLVFFSPLFDVRHGGCCCY